MSANKNSVVSSQKLNKSGSAEKSNVRGKSKEVYSDNTVINSLLENRRQFLTRNQKSIKVIEGKLGEFRVAWPVVYSVAEFIIGAAMSASDAAKQQQMIDALADIRNGLDAIQVKIGEIQNRLNDIVAMLQQLLPEIQHIVDEANLRQLILEYSSLGKSATSTIQTYIQTPQWAEQHLSEIGGALKQIQDAIYLILSAGGQSSYTMDTYLRIAPLFATMLNTWDIREKIKAAENPGNYIPVPFDQTTVFKDVKNWIVGFFDISETSITNAINHLKDDRCPSELKNKMFSLRGSVFQQETKISENLFKRVNFDVDIYTLKISQKIIPDNILHPPYWSWLAASYDDIENPKLSDPKFGLAGARADSKIFETRQRSQRTLDEYVDFDKIKKRVFAALGIV